MLTFATRVIFSDKDHSQAVVQVQSRLCFYQVAIQKELITIVGPGVEEEVDMEKIPQDLGIEAKALLSVLLFEEEQT